MNWRHRFTASPTAALSEGKAQAFSRWLVQHAARHAPPALSERLEEEWLADLATRPGRMAQVRFGIGCCWATRIIALEHCEVVAPAATTVPGHKINAYAQHASPFFSRRATFFLLIVGFHVVLAYALTSLRHTIVAADPTRIRAVVVQEEPIPVEQPEPTPQLDLTRPIFDFQPPEDLTADDSPDPNIIQAQTLPPREQLLPSVPVPQRAVNRVMGGPGESFPNTEDFYPAVSRRLGEQGIAVARVCVDERGRLTEQPTLAQSSGSARLDEGALRLARAGSGHYRPTSEDGQPVRSCYSFRIRYQMSGN